MRLPRMGRDPIGFKDNLAPRFRTRPRIVELTGMSASWKKSARLAEAIEVLTNLLEEGDEESGARMAVVAVRQGGESWSDGIARGGGTSMRPSPAARTLVYSLTKTMIAAAILRLVVKGIVVLDAPLSRWLPGLAFSDRVMLAELLQHRARLPNYGSLRDYHVAVAAGLEPWSEEEFLRRCDPCRPADVPSDGFLYSNIGYMLARLVLERATGLTFAEAMRREVFRPFGLASATVPQQRADLKGLLFGPTRLLRGAGVAEAYHPGWVAHGVAAMTAADAAAFLHGLSTTDYLPADLFRRMTDFHPVFGPMTGRPWVEPAYGMGLMAELDPEVGTYWGHTGGGPGCSSATYHFPGRVPLTVSVFTDAEDSGQAEWMAVEAARLLRQ